MTKTKLDFLQMMKKGFGIIAISLILFVGCSQEKQEISLKQPSSSSSTEAVGSDESTNSYWDRYVETFYGYNFEGENEATFGDRHFKLEVLPQNTPEELVAYDYYYDIAGEFEKLSNIYGENEALKISAISKANAFNERAYIKEYVVKNLYVMKKAELEDSKSSAIYSLNEDAEKYNLTEFTIVRAEISMTHSQEALNRGPQLGDGEYVRLFLCGKGKDVKEWKIYEVYWE